MYPYMNVGIATGEESGLVVIDLDAGGFENFERHRVSVGGDYPVTVTSQTGSGGFHLYFAYPPNGSVSSDVRILPGVDVRANGGLVVAPPSVSGIGPYRWCEGRSPFDIPVLQLPKWVMDLLSATSINKKSTKIDFEKALGGFPEGSRNQSLHALASSMRGKDIPYDEALDYILTAAENCLPPFDAREAESILTRVYKKYVPNNLQYYEKTPRSMVYDHSKAEWQNPVPLEIGNLPVFPIEVFPGWIKNFVSELAEDTQTPVDMASLIVLTALAAAAAKRLRIASHKPTWTQPLNMFGVVAIESGTKKSAVFDAVTKPIEEYEKYLKELVHNDVIDAMNQIEILKRKKKEMMAEMHRVPKDSHAHRWQLEQVRQVDRDIEAYEKIKDPKLIIDDITQEAIAAVMQTNESRIAMLSAEADVLGMIGGRYSPGGDLKLNNYIKSHDGDTIRVDRMKREEVIYEPALTIGVTTQPETLQKLGAKSEFRGSGFVGRWLFSLPNHQPGSANANSKPMSLNTIRRYSENMRKLLEIPYKDPETKTPHMLVLAENVHRYYVEMCDYIEKQRGEGGALEDLREWGSKLGGRMLRVLGLLHLAYNIQENDPWRIPVSLETFDKVSLLVPYFIAHAQAAYELLKFKSERPAAILAINKIRKNQLKTIDRQSLARITRQSGRILNDIITLLIDYGYIRIGENGKIYDINPFVHNPAN